jgi:cobyrinic acid a,c-diamide synthase
MKNRGWYGMKSLVIASNSSGGGKTTVTLGIMRTLIKRGFQVQGYKVGPDYIDPAFHAHITGKPSRNLDVFLMEEEGVMASYSRGSGDYGVIEGVMGLYDGKGIDTFGSTAHVAKLLKAPIILVISPKAQSVTLCAEINGLIEFENADIRGIILNNISESYYNLLKCAIEKNCSVEVLGYIPKDERLGLKSRHLGLVQSHEIEDLDKKIETCSQLIEEHVNVDKLLEIFKELPQFEDDFHVDNLGLRIAVARDKSFSFYYRENLELLEELGEVVYFSPLKDKELPENIDLLYLGGGYPEVFIEELSGNKAMLNSIKTALASGLRCYAECGGLMYLTESIEGFDTVGFINGKSEMTKSLQNFGYAELQVEKEGIVLPKGFKMNCHEFHKSKIESSEENVYKLSKTVYNNSMKSWNCGYFKKNTLAAYAHIHFFGNIDFIKYLGTFKK